MNNLTLANIQQAIKVNRYSEVYRPIDLFTEDITSNEFNVFIMKDVDFFMKPQFYNTIAVGLDIDDDEVANDMMPLAEKCSRSFGSDMTYMLWTKGVHVVGSVDGKEEEGIGRVRIIPCPLIQFSNMHWNKKGGNGSELCAYINLYVPNCEISGYVLMHFPIDVASLQSVLSLLSNGSCYFTQNDVWLNLGEYVNVLSGYWSFEITRKIMYRKLMGDYRIDGLTEKYARIIASALGMIHVGYVNRYGKDCDMRTEFAVDHVRMRDGYNVYLPFASSMQNDVDNNNVLHAVDLAYYRLPETVATLSNTINDQFNLTN